MSLSCVGTLRPPVRNANSADRLSGARSALSVVDSRGVILTRRTWLTVAVVIAALVLLAFILFTPVSIEGTGERGGY
jgi:hypothetical protein